MLKETENEETRSLCQTFVIGGILIEGARVPWAITFFPKRGGPESNHLTVF